MSFAAAVSLALVVGQASVPSHAQWGEPTRKAAEYFIQKRGASWTYQLRGGARGRVVISSFAEWKAQVSVSVGKRTASASWRIKDGSWLERSAARSEAEAMVLPAVMTLGTRWQGPASMEKGDRGTSLYEVVALDAMVALPNGSVVDRCLAVLETSGDGTSPYTHYYASNLGKVAVRGPDDWVSRLVEFYPGSRAHE